MLVQGLLQSQVHQKAEKQKKNGENERGKYEWKLSEIG